MREKIYHCVKRIFDIFSSGIALIILSPVWLVAIVGIFISDPGPVFYLANRVGKNNKQFCMFKFRSMRVDKNADEKSLRPDQERIFRWGGIMRDTKIDELPQLINVFIGDMSVIGPRPASVDQVEITRGGKYAATSQLKPGLSGPSALYDYIYGDGITDEAEYENLVLPTRLNLDLYYLKARNFCYDIKMIWWTVLSILTHSQRKRILNNLIKSANTVED
ncbi:MAG: sugar transferase [Lachnospiraceae bacterium]|nr:sugar transferase [Lachnospiraceae bacterium]